VDGEIRRAYACDRHPRPASDRADQLLKKPNYRSKFIIFGLLAGRLFTFIIGCSAPHAHFVLRLMGTTGARYRRSRTAEVVRLRLHPARSYLMCYRFLQVTWSFIKTGHCRTPTRRTGRAGQGKPISEWAAMPSTCIRRMKTCRRRRARNERHRHFSRC